MERKKLLIADDSEMNRAILANMLEQDFEIMEVSDGKEALAALQIYRKDLSALLLDIVMPEMDGFRVLEEMKQRQWLEDGETDTLAQLQEKGMTVNTPDLTEFQAAVESSGLYDSYKDTIGTDLFDSIQALCK